MFFMNCSYISSVPHDVISGIARFTSINVSDDVYSDYGTYNLLYKVYRIDNASQIGQAVFKIRINEDPKRRCSYMFFSHRKDVPCEDIYILPIPLWRRLTDFEKELVSFAVEPNTETLKSNIELPARYIYNNIIVFVGSAFNVDSSNPYIVIKIKDVDAGIGSSYLYFCIISYDEPDPKNWRYGIATVYTNFEVSTRSVSGGGGDIPSPLPPSPPTASGTRMISNLGSVMRSSTILNLETNEKIVIRIKK